MKSFLLLSALLFGWVAIAQQPTPHRDLRYQGVVGQTDWFTCGPAAVATLLRYYYDKEVGEAQVLELSLQAMQKPESEVRQTGINALALRQAMQTLGLPSRGFRLNLDQLADYFRRGGLPVLLHATRPEPHFVVAVGMVRDQVVLADPSWGNRILPLEGLLSEKGFSGVTLVPIPSEAQMAVVLARQAPSACTGPRAAWGRSGAAGAGAAVRGWALRWSGCWPLGWPRISP